MILLIFLSYKLILIFFQQKKIKARKKLASNKIEKNKDDNPKFPHECFTKYINSNNKFFDEKQKKFMKVFFYFVDTNKTMYCPEFIYKICYFYTV